MSFTQKLGNGYHNLSNGHKENSFEKAIQNLARHRATRGNKQQFLYIIVTKDDKLCLLVNM